MFDIIIETINQSIGVMLLIITTCSVISVAHLFIHKRNDKKL